MRLVSRTQSSSRLQDPSWTPKHRDGERATGGALRAAAARRGVGVGGGEAGNAARRRQHAPRMPSSPVTRGAAHEVVQEDGPDPVVLLFFGVRAHQVSDVRVAGSNAWRLLALRAFTVMHRTASIMPWGGLPGAC